MRSCASRTRRARPRSPPRARRSPICRPAQLNHHWTKSLIASPDGKRLYATVGSNSNVGENGLDREHQRAGILEVDLATRSVRVFASGLRNPNGMAWQKADWRAVDRGQRARRTRQRPGAGLHDVGEGRRLLRLALFAITASMSTTRVEPQKPELVAQAIAPDYALGNHTASLGLAFSEGTLLPEQFRERRLHRPARLVEPRSARRLQGDLRAVQRRAAGRACRSTC